MEKLRALLGFKIERINKFTDALQMHKYHFNQLKLVFFG